MRTSRPVSLLLALAMVTTMALGACSSGGDDKASDKTTTTKGESGGEDTATTEGEGEGDETTTTEKEDDGGDVEVSADARAYVDAMTESMKGEEDFPLSDEQTECFAARTVNTIGVDTLQAAGIKPEDFVSDNSMDFSEVKLSEDKANEMFDNFEKCGIDMHEMMLESMSLEEEMTAGQKACMETVLTEENLRKLLVSMFMEGDEGMETNPEMEEIMGGIMGCAFMGMGEGMGGETDGMGEDTTTSTTAAG